MKRTMITFALVAAVTAPAVAQAQGSKPKLPDGFTKKEGLWGYSIGRLLGIGMKPRFKNYASVEWTLLAEGFELGVYGRPIDAGKTLKVGYLLGHWIGVSNRRKLLAYLKFVEGKQLARGFAEGAQGKGSISDEQGQEAIFDLQEAMVQTMPEARRANQLKRVQVARKRARAQRAELKARLEAGRKFRAAFLAKHKDAKTTASGLIYRVLVPGKGRHPVNTESVKVHYEGKLVDGTVFDSSIKRKVPAWFGVTHGIPGWVEAIQLMRPGAKWEIVLPPNLAYDKRSAGRIKPGSTLVFQVELMEIGTPPKPGAPPKK